MCGESRAQGFEVEVRRVIPPIDYNHLGVNEATGEILSAVVSSNDVSDDQVFGQLLEVVESEIAQVSGDGAYDKRKCESVASDRGAKPTIPPRKNAVIWHHGNCKSPPHARDENLREKRMSRT